MYVYIGWASLVAQIVKRLPTMWENWASSLGREDPLEKEMAPHPSTVAWTIPWTAAKLASLPITNYQSLLKLKSITSVMPSNHLIFCCPFLLLPSIFPIIKIFSNESVLCIRWPKD